MHYAHGVSNLHPYFENTHLCSLYQKNCSELFLANLLHRKQKHLGTKKIAQKEAPCRRKGQTIVYAI